MGLPTGSKWRASACALIAAALAVPAAHGQTTRERTIVPRENADSRAFRYLVAGAGQPYVTRDPLGVATPARERQRRSLAYFAQLTDFQIADEESPARVEFLDQAYSAFSSAWRPHEALLPHLVDASIRRINATRTSPVPQGDGRRAPLGFAVTTGDNADNQQRNEARWVATLLDGGDLDPNSGRADAGAYRSCPTGARELLAKEAPRYTGVQDYDDYFESGHFWDPDKPSGQFAAWPRYPGLMDRAQKPFRTPGLDVPSYVAVGNHDSLVQGNDDANAAYEAVAVGCVKPMHGAEGPNALSNTLNPDALMSNPSGTALVPPDPDRAFVTQPEYRALFAGEQVDDHGFAFVDPAELKASAGAASYYDFSPVPGLRLIALDTVALGGVPGVTDKGNIDDPQFTWLKRELKAAADAGELVVVYGHHAAVSMTANVPDETAGPCGNRVRPQDEADPGCDLDPRASTPIHLGPDVDALLAEHPNVIAWVAGHSHENDVAFTKSATGTSGFWTIRTSAEADWPHQDRLLEIMDNRDGTLSIFGTLVDNAAPVTARPPGTDASKLDVADLASIGRTVGFNDPHADRLAGGEAEKDRNVELVVPDPRTKARSLRIRAGARGRRTVVRVAPRRAVRGRLTRFRVRVLRAGRPVRGARVRLAGRSAHTGARGRAVLRVRLRRLGTYHVRAGRARTPVLVVRRR